MFSQVNFLYVLPVILLCLVFLLRARRRPTENGRNGNSTTVRKRRERRLRQRRLRSDRRRSVRQEADRRAAGSGRRLDDQWTETRTRF